MKEEILAGYPITAFLQAQEGRDWKPDTRRRYSKYLYELGEYLAGQGPPGKAALERWQRQLEERCGPSGVKAYLAAANHYFRWCGRPDLVMRRHRGPEEAREGAGPPGLSRAEYLKLLRTARGMREHRTYLLVKLFATTGLPLQCLDQVTVEAVEAGGGELNYRGSPVEFRCPEGLRQELLEYAAERKTAGGAVFVTRTGQPLDRSNLFRSMQELCRAAGIPAEKVNPRSLRRLYQAAQETIREHLEGLQRQMYEQMLEMEQDAVGWRMELPSGRTRPAGRQARSGPVPAGTIDRVLPGKRSE